MTRKLLDFCLANHDWLLELIESLVAIESPSDDPQAVNRCGAELTSRLQTIGGTVTRIGSPTAGDHVRLTARVTRCDNVSLSPKKVLDDTCPKRP